MTYCIALIYEASAWPGFSSTSWGCHHQARVLRGWHQLRVDPVPFSARKVKWKRSESEVKSLKSFLKSLLKSRYNNLYLLVPELSFPLKSRRGCDSEKLQCDSDCGLPLPTGRGPQRLLQWARRGEHKGAAETMTHLKMHSYYRSVR